jgi:hypothetical protein
MHPFHEYLSRQLSELLTKRRVVLFYDPRRDFTAFIEELNARETSITGVSQTEIGNLPTTLILYDGSFFAVRSWVEPLVAVDRPEPLLIYLPGVDRDRRGSVLMELELAGDCYEPQLKRLARNVLRERYTDGIIDEMLAPEKLGYSDIVALLDQGAGIEPASILKVIFDSARDNADIIAAWLASPDKDQAVRDKEVSPNP